MSKRIYLFVFIGLGLACLIDLVFPDHHHVVFPWHTIPAFDAAFGLMGGIVLIVFSLSLGEVLWKRVVAVPFSHAGMSYGGKTGKVVRLLVGEGQAVKEGQPLVEIENDRGVVQVLSAPKPGKISRLFFDPEEEVNTGETVVNVEVTRKSLKDLLEERGEAHV